MPQTSIHIRPVHAGSEEHNERKKKLDHVRSDLSKLNENWAASLYTCNADLLAEIKEDYKAEHGKKLHAKATPIREGVVVIQENTTMEQILAAGLRCEEEFGIRLLAVSVHRDEGHFEEGPNPMTPGPWVGNYHAHLTWCWYDWRTHTTCKLNRDDTAAMQTIFAQELGMDRGTPGTKKGLDAITFKVKKKLEQLAALEERGKLDTAKAAQLRQQIADLEQRQAEAQAKAEAAEKAASREQLRSNAADVGARIMGVFGRGAVAEGKEAQKRAEEAEQRAAAAEQAAVLAQEAQKQAELDRSTAQAAESKARREKDAYGREMYESGVADGVAQGLKRGRASAQESIAPLQQQLAQKQDAIEKLQADRDDKVKAAQQEIQDMISWNPNMKDWRKKLADMREANMKKEDIQKVFMKGSVETTVTITHNYKEHQVPVTVAIGTLRSAANAVKNGVWFKFQNSWYPVKEFLTKALNHIRSLNPSKGMHR